MMKTEIKQLLDKFVSKSDQEIIDSLISIYELVDNLINKIQSCIDMQEAEQYFDKLQDIILLLDYVKYQRKIKLGKLWQFYKDFDRIDDIRVREYMLEDIKSGEYVLPNDESKLLH